MCYSPVRHSPPKKQASSCCRSTCMCKACRQRSIWAMIKLFSLIHCLSHFFLVIHCWTTTQILTDIVDCLFDQAICFVLSSMSICILKSDCYIRLATYAHTYRLLIFNELFNQPCLGLVIFESFCTGLRRVQERDYEAFQTNCQVFILQTRQFTSQLFPLVLRGLGCEEVRLWTHSAQRSSPIFKIVTIYLLLILNKPADRKN